MSVLKLIQKPLSDLDIQRILGKDIKIIKYTELGRYYDLDDFLIDEIDYCIVLYENAPNIGHWIAILKYNKLFEFFDPYGHRPDSQLSWTDIKMRRKLGVSEPYLTNLFKRDDYIYNKVRFQEDNIHVNTCGSHCCFRIYCLKNYHYDLDQYQDMMKSLKRELNHSYDYIVAKFVYTQLYD